jgi:hypothetical protein
LFGPSKRSLPWMVSTRLALSHAAIALSSRLLVPTTAASSSCHAVYDAAACTSAAVSGRLALVARSRNTFVNSAATGEVFIGGWSSKIVTLSAPFASGDCTIGPGAG